MTASTHSFRQLRDHAIAAFGQTPSAQLEQNMLDAFQQHPALVAALIDDLADKVAAGTVRSGWAVLNHQLHQATTTVDVIVTSDRDRDTAVAHVDQWLAACGVHVDRERDLLDELFGDRGPLRSWGQFDYTIEDADAGFRGDEQLRDRMLARWRQLRPAGEQLETDADERGRVWADHRYRQDPAVWIRSEGWQLSREGRERELARRWPGLGDEERARLHELADGVSVLDAAPVTIDDEGGAT